jgi:hypothetical protein
VWWWCRVVVVELVVVELPLVGIEREAADVSIFVTWRL